MSNQVKHICYLCNYETTIKSNYAKHCNTSRHIHNKKLNENQERNEKQQRREQQKEKEINKEVNKEDIRQRTVSESFISKFNPEELNILASYENRLFLIEKTLVNFIKVQERRYNELNYHISNQNKRITRLLEEFQKQNDRNLDFDSRIDLLEETLPEGI